MPLEDKKMRTEMKKITKTLWTILFLVCALIIGCSGGGGGGNQQPVDHADESALITSTLKSFLASVQDSDSRTARGFYSESLQSSSVGIDLTVSDLGGPTFDPALKRTFIFTILPGDIVYLSPDLCIVKAICENLEGYRVVITFTMSKTAGIWLIDNIDTQNTAIPVAPAPTISTLTPDSGLNLSLLNISIAGTGFKTGATIHLTRSGQTTVSGTEVAVNEGGTTITCTLPLSGLQAGLWSVVVINPDGQSVTSVTLLTVSEPDQPPPDLPAPTISQLSPNTGINNSSLAATIYGTGFQNLATVKLINGATTVNATGIVVAQNGTSIACTLPLNGLQTGTWDVVVTNPDTKTVTGSNLLTVSLPPSLSSISPATGQVGCIVTLSGNYLGTGGTIKVGEVTAGSITWSSQTITFAIPSGVTSGPQTVTVTPAGTQSSAQQTFTVPIWLAQTVTDVTDVLNDVDFDGTTGWIVGGNSILKSTDSGKTWSAVSGAINAMGVNLRGVRALAGKVLMVGSCSSMDRGYYLTDRTGQWVENPHGGSSELFAVAGTSLANNLVIAGIHAVPESNIAVGQIAHSQDYEWIDVTPNPPEDTPTTIPFNVKHLSTPDGQVYYAVGDLPIPNSSDWGLAKSTDKGVTWVMHTQDDQSIPPFVNYCGVHFLDADRGWAVGENGTIIKTINGGTTWAQQEIDGSLSSVSLRSVYFTDAQNGIVVGDAGTMLTTTDGGTTWTLLSQPPTTQDLKRVKFTDASNGWIVGGNGVILRTTTGGR